MRPCEVWTIPFVCTACLAASVAAELNADMLKPVFQKALPNGNVYMMEHITSRYVPEHPATIKNSPRSIRVLGGEFTFKDYSLYLNTRTVKNDALLWKKTDQYLTSERPNPFGFRLQIYDVRIGNDCGYILYLWNANLKVDTIKRAPGGQWKVVATNDILRESDALGRYVVSAELLPDSRVRVVFLIAKDEVEEWSFAEKTSKLVSKTKLIKDQTTVAPAPPTQTAK